MEMDIKDPNFFCVLLPLNILIYQKLGLGGPNGFNSNLNSRSQSKASHFSLKQSSPKTLKISILLSKIEEQHCIFHKSEIFLPETEEK